MGERKKVVICGGGIAGSQIAYALQDVADVTLIDPKDYLEVTYAALRSILEPKIAERSLILHKDYLPRARLVTSAAKCATPSEVATVSGERIPYDFLIITTGTTFHAPPNKATRVERLEQFRTLNAKLLDAGTVLIVGGGPVGVELAGEVVTDFPDKKVTIVHSGDRLIEFLGTKASKKTLKWLQGKGVQVICKDRLNDVHSLKSPSYETAKHVEITADAHFVAIGKKVGIKWIEDSPFLKERVTVEGRVQVNPTTQVVGLSNVFAAGDVTDFKEIKQGYLATQHAAVVVQNIKKLIKKPDETNLAVYKPASSPMGIVSLGRVVAVAQMPFGTVLGRLPGLLKSKDLFVGKSRTALGLRAK